MSCRTELGDPLEKQMAGFNVSSFSLTVSVAMIKLEVVGSIVPSRFSSKKPQRGNP